MSYISELTAIKAIEQLQCGFEWTGRDDLEKLFTQLHQVDTNCHFQATSKDYADVALQFTDLMNQTIRADQNLWFFVDYGKLFTGCEISHHHFSSEDDYNFTFTLKFNDIKRFNIVRINISMIWGADKFLQHLENPNYIEALHDVTLENFFVATAGEWDSCQFVDVPSQATVIQRSDSGSVQFTMPDEPGTVYRISDHWGSGIGQCNWYLRGQPKKNSFRFKEENGGKLFCGKVSLHQLCNI